MDTHQPTQSEKPETFQKLEDLARSLFAVPKSEVDKLEEEEKRKARKRTDLRNEKPAE
jgi:hypothetical protein